MFSEALVSKKAAIFTGRAACCFLSALETLGGPAIWAPVSLFCHRMGRKKEEKAALEEVGTDPQDVG